MYSWKYVKNVMCVKKRTIYFLRIKSSSMVVKKSRLHAGVKMCLEKYPCKDDIIYVCLKSLRLWFDLSFFPHLLASALFTYWPHLTVSFSLARLLVSQYLPVWLDQCFIPIGFWDKADIWVDECDLTPYGY